jgi:hypothetical protein
MTAASHSVYPGTGCPGTGTVRWLAGRAVLLSHVAVLVSLSLVTVNAAEPASAEVQAAAVRVEQKVGEPTFHRIGPVTTVTEVSSGLPFPARVDTGATTCSIHYEEIEIEDAAESPEDNIGKRVRILIRSPEGEKEWVSTKIVDRVTVRTTTDDDARYKVQLKLRWQDVEKKVLVTLSDREKMKYPLLIGRNFLKGDFVVDVDMPAEE